MPALRQPPRLRPSSLRVKRPSTCDHVSPGGRPPWIYPVAIRNSGGNSVAHLRPLDRSLLVGGLWGWVITPNARLGTRTPPLWTVTDRYEALRFIPAHPTDPEPSRSHPEPSRASPSVPEPVPERSGARASCRVWLRSANSEDRLGNHGSHLSSCATSDKYPMILTINRIGARRDGTSGKSELGSRNLGDGSSQRWCWTPAVAVSPLGADPGTTGDHWGPLGMTGDDWG